MLFFKKKNDTSKELMDPETYGKLLNRIAERDQDLQLLKVKVANLELGLSSLRGKFGSKLKELKEEAVQDKTEDLINSNELPFG